MVPVSEAGLVVALQIVFTLQYALQVVTLKNCGHLVMNIIFKMTSLVNMTESGCANESKLKKLNGSFQNQEEQASTSGPPRRSRKQSPPIWEPLMLKKVPRGNPKGWRSN